jgi:predicted transcriptional regulator
VNPKTCPGRSLIESRLRDIDAEAVAAKPGARPSEIATALGVTTNQIYTHARRLQKDGAIRKSGKGYRLKK